MFLDSQVDGVFSTGMKVRINFKSFPIVACLHLHPKQTTTGLEWGGADSRASWAAALTTGCCLYSAWHSCSLHHGLFLWTSGSRRQSRLQNGATLRTFSHPMVTSHQLGAQRSVSAGLAQFPLLLSHSSAVPGCFSFHLWATGLGFLWTLQAIVIHKFRSLTACFSLSTMH